MADWEENEPGEHLVWLLKVLLGVIVLYLFLPCGACGLGLDPAWLARTSGLPVNTSVLLVCVVPGLLAVALSVVGAVLARSTSSRLLFAGLCGLGIAVPLVLLLIATYLRW
jgi:hypothetical protein